MFSAKERAMFRALGFTDKMIDSYESKPITLYYTALRDPREELNKAEKSVYRCLKNLVITPTIQRNTPEFEELIDV